MIDGGASSQRVMVVKKTQVVSRVESLLECPTRTPTRSAIVVTPLAAKTSIQVESFVSLSLSQLLSRSQVDLNLFPLYTIDLFIVAIQSLRFNCFGGAKIESSS